MQLISVEFPFVLRNSKEKMVAGALCGCYRSVVVGHSLLVEPFYTFRVETLAQPAYPSSFEGAATTKYEQILYPFGCRD